MKISVILPSLNPDEKLMMVVKGLLAEGFDDIILINDGSDETHMGPFKEAAGYKEVTILTHEVNKGKGRALKTGFLYCMEHRTELTGVVTVDGDNQHTPKDIKACCEALAAHPNEVILGCRQFDGKEVPWKSKLGNLMTRSVFAIACGANVSDTQTGLRAFAAPLLPTLTKIEGERFEYETRVLLELNQQGIQFREIPIETVYIDENATTHFHVVRDSLKIYGVIFPYMMKNFLSFAKFSLGSILAFLVDNGIFTVIGHLLLGVFSDQIRILLATAAGRVFSSLFDYFFSRYAVFKTKSPVKNSMLRYYILCVVQMLASALLVYGLKTLFTLGGYWESLYKIVVDSLLFIASYQIQKRWVFAEKKQD